MSPRLQVARIQGAARQRGAVLYVALIMLVLLALIGVVALQVAGMQERMAASYRAVNLAFQFTEERARATECGLEVLPAGRLLVVRICAVFDAYHGAMDDALYAQSI